MSRCFTPFFVSAAYEMDEFAYDDQPVEPTFDVPDDDTPHPADAPDAWVMADPTDEELVRWEALAAGY